MLYELFNSTQHLWETEAGLKNKEKKSMHWTIPVTILILSLVMIANLYVGISYHRLLKNENKRKTIVVYWILHSVLAIGFVLNFALFFTGTQWGNVSLVIRYVAALTAGFFLYSIAMFVIKDIFNFLSKFIKFPHFSRKIGRALIKGGMLIAACSMLISIYGVVNAKTFQVVEYKVSLDKKSSTLDHLHIEFISDAHLGSAINASDLKKIVDKINAQEPEMVVIGGDFFDDGTSEVLKEQAGSILAGLKSEYGTFYVVGNHERYLEDHAADEKYLTDAGIQIINDQVVTVQDKFILVGRQDKTGGARENFETVMAGVDTASLPVIVIDHEPDYTDMKSVSAANADLQISGHTHAGQLFPITMVDFLKISPSYGEYQTGNLKTLVSAGVGSWAVPIRVGSPSEIMSVMISFS